MPLLKINGLSKAYGSDTNRNVVLRDVNLAVEEGEFVAILGFSGTGKTTLISAIAGLIAPDEGEIVFRDKPVMGPAPERGVVFQNYSLLPWLTVAGNVALAVDQVFRREKKTQRRARVAGVIDMVGLSHASERRPAELSGGMRQRVAVARALAMSPQMLLLDEPLSALDALTRAKLQDEIERIWEADKKTVILITNDVDEAILLADRIIPLDPSTLPGEGATLGQEFKVDLPRPRDRGAVNRDPAFKQLRGEITRYLMQVGANSAALQENDAVLPDVVPIRRRQGPPAAWAAAAKSPIEERYVEFYDVSKVYPTPKGPLTVVDGFELKMRQGEFVSLIGHSGCGKSTVLSMIAGLNEISDGGIVLDGREIDRAGPDRAVVFQAPSLMPWLSARDNVGLGVDRVFPHASRTERNDIVEYYLARVGLGDAMDKAAVELSNGMKQRVGIARAFALSPKLLLLDEPFGMLDSLTRWELQDVLMEVWQRTQVTAICVTHDVDEAILLADRVVMMSNGPNARVGNIMEVNLPRPRTRKDLLEHADYYAYREELLEFLEAYEGGANPTPEQIASIQQKRTTRQRAVEAAE
ncbi:nitrate/nitrite transport system ATP-binding protein [Breoghania corrubedonensis]|uniref:Nitrate/nitrite transport system ATP-binding protein n=1 Tax=Breoghania corrubedonensis TaxID=665038 RepID=A0A2T5VHI7_9HYPH|nr:nitrate ABC transporter ATP-binding protein [Breoghania corrubedonensis]PTW63196.1 nitrate/nitrite transport system ATP-binding protein [Breoghania corrubedonensis]